MWTDDQWTTFCALLEEWWPGDFDESARAAWRVALDGTAPADVSRAAQVLLLKGNRFRPSASEFLAELRRDPSALTFDEALILIRRALGRSYTVQEAMDELASYPVVQSFAFRQGVDRLRLLPIDDPEWGEKHRRTLDDAWQRHVETTDDREIGALVEGGSLRQLDPLASLRLVPGDSAA